MWHYCLLCKPGQCGYLLFWSTGKLYLFKFSLNATTYWFFLSHPATFANSFSARGGTSLYWDFGLFVVLHVGQLMCVCLFLYAAALWCVVNTVLLHYVSYFCFLQSFHPVSMMTLELWGKEVWFRFSIWTLEPHNWQRKSE